MVAAEGLPLEAAGYRQFWSERKEELFSKKAISPWIGYSQQTTPVSHRLRVLLSPASALYAQEICFGCREGNLYRFGSDHKSQALDTFTS